MNIYKAILSYNGQAYEGWQIQPHTDKTIQGQVNKALRKITKSDEFKTLGSGRTDSGVHAIAQVCKMSLPILLEGVSLLRALNSHLPPDIRCLSVERLSEDFHPVKDALWKSYDYIVFNGEILSPLLFGRVTHFRYDLDVNEMHKTLNALVGQRDFKNFSTKGTEVATTIRTLYSAKLLAPSDSQFANIALDKSFLHFRFVGSGFLKQMVRLLVSSVLDSGRGKINHQEVEEFLLRDTELKIAPTAKADGLYLSHVEYKDAWSPSIDNRLHSR